MGQGAIPDIDERRTTLNLKGGSLDTIVALCPGIFDSFLGGFVASIGVTCIQNTDQSSEELFQDNSCQFIQRP